VFKKAEPSEFSTAERESMQKFPELLGDIDKQGNIAMYYGFTPIKTPTLSKDDHKERLALKASGKDSSKLRESSRSRGETYPTWEMHERLALMRMFVENEMQRREQPAMFYFKRPFSASGLRRSPLEIECGLDIIGNGRSISEALIIQAAIAILQDEGFQNLSIEINSVGDRDAMQRHERELSAYIKRHSDSIPAKWRSEFRSAPLSILSCPDPECDNFKEAAPKSVSFLNEPSRKHFMEVLEFLEILDIPYKINYSLLSSRHFATHTIFHINEVVEGKERLIAQGSRYGAVSRKLALRKEIPAVGVTIHYKRPVKSLPWKSIGKPKFYFIQLGDDARLKSLRIIESLRREHISVHHSLTRDKLLGQLSHAENLNVPYLLIMGQKEALENAVVVRDLHTRAQETVSIHNLVHYLKKLR